MWLMKSSIVTGRSRLIIGLTVVRPITPPFSARLRIISSVLLRGCSLSASHFVCEKTGGRLENFTASRVVCGPECALSTRMPSSFMRSTTAMLELRQKRVVRAQLHAGVVIPDDAVGPPGSIPLFHRPIVSQRRARPK
jgi:hypothetical protein